MRAKGLTEAQMSEKRFGQKTFWLVFLLAFLVFFAHTRSFLLLFDGLTYSAVAKNILKTGDWKVLHYSLEQYTDFYQQPPLAFWIQALVYKAFGWAEPIARIFPSLCAVLTVVSVFLFTRARFSLTAAFYASIALVTSTRFVKWGSNFYMEGILSFFCFSSLSLWLWALTRKEEKKWMDSTLSFLSGVLLWSALMTKGAVAGAVAGLCGVSFLFFFSRRTLVLALFFLGGFLFPFLAWIQMGNGWDYLQKYLTLSLLGRVQAHELSPHPWRNIYKLWWPWWPIFAVSIYHLIKMGVTSFRASKQSFYLLSCVLLAALSFPVGFTFGATYLEHYITPFYPFASVLVGVQIAQWIKPMGEATLRWAYGLLIVAAVFLATVAPNVNQQKELPPTRWIQEIRTLPTSAQTQIQQIVFTEKSGELWFTLATILGRTDWQAIGNYALNRPAKAHSILVSKRGEIVSSTWEKMDCLYTEGFEYYAPKGEPWCPKELDSLN